MSVNNVDQTRGLVVSTDEPISLRTRGKNRWFVDYGKAMFGTIAVTIRASRTGTAEVCLSEKLADSGRRIDRQPPGHIRTRVMTLPLRRGRHTYQVEIPPDKRNTEQPYAVLVPDAFFEVLPFRYAEIKVSDCDADLLSANRLSLHAPFDNDASHFSCNDSRLNDVWELCKHSMKATSFLGIYVDGDRERIAYEADAYINQLSHYAVDSSYAYTMARNTLEHLLELSTWPTEWVLHLVPMAWADYLYTGNKELFIKHYNTLRDRLLLPLARRDGLISSTTGLATKALQRKLHIPHPLKDIVDWPPASFTQGGAGERDGYEMVDINTVVNAFHYWNLELFASINRTLGKKGVATRYDKLAKRVGGAIRRKLFDPTRGIYRDGEGTDHTALHATLFPAAFGLLPRNARDSADRFIRDRGMACSVYAAQYLLEACYRLDMADHALDLMTAEHDRGWLNMIKSGSTVTLEAWDWRYKNNLDWNHAWGAAPGNIIPRFLVGVQPQQPGFTTANIAPQPAGLESFTAKVPTIQGSIEISYAKAETLTVNSPVPFTLNLAGISTKPGRPRLCQPGSHTIPL
jgi:hypothetical protein